MAETSWTARDYHQSIRELLKHEDGLINERLRTLLLVQTLLTGVLAAKWGVDQFRPPVLLLASFGLISSLVFWRELYYSNKAFNNVLASWYEWDETYRDIYPDHMIPPIIGAIDDKVWPAALVIGPLLVVFWLIVLASSFPDQGLLGLVGIFGIFSAFRQR